MREQSSSPSLAEVTAVRDGLIESAATGKSVTAMQLRDAERAVRDAKTDAALAGAVAQHQRAGAERGRIQAHAEAGAALMKQLTDAIALDVAATAALNDALEKARVFVTRKNEAANAIREIDLRILDHNRLLDAEAQTNGVLAATPRSEWPRQNALTRDGLVLGAPLRIEVVQFLYGQRHEKSRGDVVRPSPVRPVANDLPGYCAVAASAAAVYPHGIGAR